ncbi:helix-turn-helix domain-containing protein [Mycobacterium avium]
MQSTRAPGRSNKFTAAETGLPALLTIEQVAEATKLSTATIRRYCASGLLKSHRLGKRVLRIEADSVGALLDPIGAE